MLRICAKWVFNTHDASQHKRDSKKLQNHRRYTAKLRDDLDSLSKEVFQLSSDRERVQSILQDLNKTSRDFNAIGGRAVEQLSGLLIARVR